jgi:hypothetical protein
MKEKLEEEEEELRGSHYKVTRRTGGCHRAKGTSEVEALLWGSGRL